MFPLSSFFHFLISFFANILLIFVSTKSGLDHYDPTGPEPHIYVTGAKIINGQGYDFVVIKYLASNGSQIWAQTYNGTGNGDDIAHHVEVDAGGNVFVTGHSWNGSNYDYATIKYNTGGIPQWVSRYDGGFGNDTGKTLKIDGNGYIYVT